MGRQCANVISTTRTNGNCCNCFEFCNDVSINAAFYMECPVGSFAKEPARECYRLRAGLARFRPRSTILNSSDAATGSLSSSSHIGFRTRSICHTFERQKRQITKIEQSRARRSRMQHVQYSADLFKHGIRVTRLVLPYFDHP